MSANGYLGPSDLSPAAGGIPGPNPGQGQLAKEAAAAWNAMNAYAVAHLNTHLTCDGPDSMYRPYADQVALRNSWCARGACQNAAVPGTSNHGWGTAVDMPPYVQAICDSSACAQFGWNKQYSDAPWESWHRHYGGTYHGKDPGGGGSGPVGSRYPLLKRGAKGGAVKRAQKHLHRWNVGIARPKPDGSFGRLTERAAKEFQITHGLHPDGKIGPATWKKLRQVDPYLADERGHLNKLRLIRHRGGQHSKRAREYRAWCLKRAASIKKVAAQYGWKGQHRRSRYKTLRQAAGGEVRREMPNPIRLLIAQITAIPPNRVVAVLAPLLAGVAGGVASWLAVHFPGIPNMDSAHLTAIFIAGALFVVTLAWKWLSGWQAHEARTSEAHSTPVDDIHPDDAEPDVPDVTDLDKEKAKAAEEAKIVAAEKKKS